MHAIPLPPSWPAHHLFTVDVEEYFQVNAFEGSVAREQWDRYPSRLEHNLDVVLGMLDERAIRGTFFTLGWIAAKYPSLVRRLADLGHEVASHGYWHRKVTTLSLDAFRDDVRASKTAIEEATGRPCLGFRAPSFSIRPGMEWAFEVLTEEGFLYDSSIFPISRPDYGYPQAPPFPVMLHTASGQLLELPLATTRLAGLRFPAAGGGYLRQLPFGLIVQAFSQWGEIGITSVLYTHPWELDPDQPRLPCDVLTQIRHYRNLARTEARLRALLDKFKFTSVLDRFGDVLGVAGPRAVPEPTQPAA